ncbi:MAG: hypothetical protein JEZ00_03450 [Anaerolineaceae bacterium]|nr:hypothetical protein [Anaerolineaceae bacterium]
MKNPAGIECEFFYGNYFRGQSTEECRLINRKTSTIRWAPEICKICPVPRIKLANSCKNMVLSASIQTKWFGLKKYVHISAYCSQTEKNVEVPEIGCGECHPIQDIFNNIAE